MVKNNRNRIFLVSTFFLMVVSFSTFSKPPVSFFSELPVASSPQKYGLLAHSARINPAVIIQASEQIRLLLPKGQEILALKDGFDQRGRGSFTWRGRVENQTDSRVILTLHRSYVFGSIRIKEDVYEIRPLRGKSAIYSLEKLNMPSFYEDVPDDDVLEEVPDVSVEDVIPAAADLNGNHVIHLLSLYSIEAEVAAGGVAQIEAHIQSAVDVANTAFIDSNMTARFVLVHTASSNRNDSGNSLTDLQWLQDDVGVASLRDQYGADLVSMIIETGGCGRGYVLTTSGGSPNYAHQVSERGCAVGNKTFAHEHGHNMGFAHDPDNATSASYHSWSKGHYIDGDYRTVMSYSSSCGSGCSRVAHFSSPNVNHNGLPTGIVNERDNARTGNVTAAIVAGYRQAVLTENNAPVAGFTYICNDLSCDFTDTSSDSDGTIVGHQWDFADGSNSTEANPSHTYEAAGSYSVSLQATDNGELTDTILQMVTVQAAGPQPPAAPSNLTASVVTTGKGKRATKAATLSWVDNSDSPDNEDSFVVERCKIEGKGKNKTCIYSQLKMVAQDTTSYSDNPGTGSFKYRVIAVNSSGESAPSNEVKL